MFALKVGQAICFINISVIMVETLFTSRQQTLIEVVLILKHLHLSSVEVSGQKKCSSNHLIRSEYIDMASYLPVNVSTSILPSTLLMQTSHVISALQTPSPDTVNKQQFSFIVPPEPASAASTPCRYHNYKMATCDILPGAVHVLRLGFMRFYVNAINAEMKVQAVRWYKCSVS